jgi:hypothetical protein
MRAETDAGSFGENKVAFVTFNYDRLVEYYLDVVLTHAFSLTEEEARAIRNSIPIIHLHGKIQERSFGDFTSLLVPNAAKKIASGIRIIHDAMPTNDPNFDAAYEHISKARRVVLMGLGYHSENIRRLRLSSLISNASYLFGSGYNVGRAEFDVAQRRLGMTLNRGGPKEKAEEFLRERVPLD